MITSKNRNFGLDAVRAIAITLVLLGHTIVFFPNDQSIVTDMLQVLGVYGVEIFFVLSGFLIGNILIKLIETTSFTLKVVLHFWIRRWFRTLPLYFIVLILNVVLLYFFFDALPDRLWKYFLFLQNFSNEYLPFFPESWSLSIEEYAYLLAPIGLFLTVKFFNWLNLDKRKVFLLNALILICVFLFLKYMFYQNNIDIKQTFKSWNVSLKAIVIYRLDSIFIGFVLVYFFNSRNEYFMKNRLLMLCSGAFVLSILLVALYIYPLNQHNTFFWNVLYLPMNSLAIGAVLPYFYFLDIKPKRFKSFIRSISLYSYSMYLLHYTFISYFIYQWIDLKQLNWTVGVFCSIMYLGAVYVISRVSYCYIEQPLTELRDSKFIKSFFSK